MNDITYDNEGNVDWNANGWPEPNPGADASMDGYSIEGMPDDIFDQWINECDNLDTGWEVDW